MLDPTSKLHQIKVLLGLEKEVTPTVTPEVITPEVTPEVVTPEVTPAPEVITLAVAPEMEPEAEPKVEIEVEPKEDKVKILEDRLAALEELVASALGTLKAETVQMASQLKEYGAQPAAVPVFATPVVETAPLTIAEKRIAALSAIKK